MTPIVAEKEIIVRGFHLDLYLHVNHARYLEFLEEARWELLEQSKPIEWLFAKGIGLVIVNINVNYRLPAKLNDVLLIKTFVSKTGTKSVIMHQDIYLKSNQTLVLDADITFVIVDLKTGKSILLDDEIKSVFKHES